MTRYFTSVVALGALAATVMWTPHLTMGQPPDPVPQAAPAEEVPRTVPLTNSDDAKSATLDETRKTAAIRFEAVTGLNLQPAASGQLVVSKVQPDSTGADAGVKEGDVVLEVDDVAITDGRQLADYLVQHEKLSAFLISFARGDKSFTAAVGRNVELVGMMILPDGSNRPAVRRVVESSPAAEAGVKRADLIAVVNGQKVKDFGEFVSTIVPLLQEMAPGDELSLGLLRVGQDVEVVVTRPDDLKLPPVNVPDSSTHLAVKAGAARPSADVAATMLFTTRSLATEPGQVPPIEALHATGWLTISLDHGRTLVDARVVNMPAGDYTVAVHRYGDTRNLAQDSAGEVLQIFGKLSVDSAGNSRFHEELDDVRPIEMVGRVVSLIPHDPEPSPPSVSDNQTHSGRYHFGAFGVLGLAQPTDSPQRKQ